MQKCNYCGADLPENIRFCGKCGNMQNATSTDATTISNTPQPQYWTTQDGTIPATRPPSATYPAQNSAPAWFPNELASETPPPGAEDEDERRRDTLPPPLFPLYDAAIGGEALLGRGQASTPGTPVVQGTPQIGSVPSMPGSPTLYTNSPAQGAANASAGPPAQGAANASAGPPVQGPANIPVSQPVQGPTNMPYPQPRPQPTPQPRPQPTPQPTPQPRPQPTPQPPGGPGTHKHHRHHEHDEHHTHRAQYRAASATKAAGGSVIKTIIIVAIIVVVVIAGGIGVIHFLFPAHPQPLISISSKFKVGQTVAGANGTTLHISGQQFASNSAITFLLDGHAAPGNQDTRSDANGNFSTDMTITNAWSVGTHTLTASDASNDSTKNSISVTIVQPGQANTPGPNGAPPDDATFTLNIPVNGRNNTVNQQFTNNEETLQITGHPDSAGGTVCLNSDNGQQLNASYTDTNGLPFTESYSFSCKGSYESGKINYTETLLTDVVNYTSNIDGSNITCTLTSPQLNQQVTGSYTGNGTFTGTWTYGPVPTSDFSCTNNSTFFYSNNNGTWTATVSGLQS